MMYLFRKCAICNVNRACRGQSLVFSLNIFNETQITQSPWSTSLNYLTRHQSNIQVLIGIYRKVVNI